MEAIPVSYVLAIFDYAENKDEVSKDLFILDADFQWVDDIHLKVLTTSFSCDENKYEIFTYRGHR